MSQICLLELKGNLCYDDMNNLCRNLVTYVYNINLGIRFNSKDYCENLVLSEKMSFYCLISDSFLHCNAEFLDFPYPLDNITTNAKKFFINKYSFLKEIIDIIFKYDIDIINVYISEDGMVDEKVDFKMYECKGSNFLNILYSSIIDNVDEYQYNFPSICVQIYK